MRSRHVNLLTGGVLILGLSAPACAPESDSGTSDGGGSAGASGSDGSSRGDMVAPMDAISGAITGAGGGQPSAGRDGGAGAADRDAGAGRVGDGSSASDTGTSSVVDGATFGDGHGGGADGGSSKSAGCGSATAPKSNTYMLNVGGVQRTYILRVPENYDVNRPYRLILAFHWLNGTAQNVSSENFYGLWSLSSGSTIFAAPQGINNGWSDSGRTNTAGGQDINFTKALVDDLTRKLCIDRSRIFAEGFSMGGSMSYAVACAMPDVVRGVVAHSGGPMSGCVQHDKPVAYFMTHGTQDNVCTYPQYGVPQINDFAKVNGCMPQEMPVPTANTHPCVDFPGCTLGYPARACIFVGSHTPSPPGNWVPMESWKFISQF